MIVILLFIFIICFFLSWNLAKNNVLRFSIGGFFAGLIVIIIALITLNFHDHLGMKKQTFTSDDKYYSTSPQMNLILYQPIGTKGHHQVIIYHKNKDQSQKKPTVTPAIDTTNKIVTTNNQQKLVKAKEQWVFKNSFYQFMFGLVEKPITIHKTNTFYVPKNFTVLSAKQAQVLPKLIKQKTQQMNNPQMQQQQAQLAQQFVQNKVMLAKQNNPNLNKNDEQKITKQATDEFKQQQQQQLMQQLQPELNKIK